jgi:hypothetical protein
MSEESERGFRVTDRRRFSDSGEARVDADEQAGGPPPAPEARRETGRSTEDEAVTFASFVLGLSTQVLLHLGDVVDPAASGAGARDLPAAKHLIDLLGILHTKTRNNLEPNEEKLLDSILYDLRMRYVELSRSPG